MDRTPLQKGRLMRGKLLAARITFHHYKGHGFMRYRMALRSYRANLIASPREEN